jgi:plasmid stability protein
MPNVLIRDVDTLDLDRIKARAKRQNRSLQAEMKIIIKAAAERRDPISELELIRKIRASNKKINKTDSVDLLREDRNR